MELDLDVHEEKPHKGKLSNSPKWVWPDVQTPLGLAGLFLLVVFAYALGSRLALLLIEMSGLQGVFFIPAGITVAFLIRLPRRSWWVVLVAAGIAELIMDLAAGISLSSTLGFVAANTIEPLVGALIVVAMCADLDLTRRRDLLWFTIGAVLAGPFVGAALGAGADAVLGAANFGETFWQWWLGDALGVLLVGGAILSWGSSPDRRSLLSYWGAVLLVGCVLGTWLVLGVTHLPLAFLVMIAVVIAGALFGTRAVTVISLSVATTIAVFFAVSSGAGIIMGLSLASALVVIKLQVATVALAGMLVAAEAHEREIALEGVVAADAIAEAAQGERERQRELAVRVQRGLMPNRLIDQPGFDLAVQHRSREESLEIGGDWYDSIDLGAGRFGLVVGDVVGHGIEAMTAMGRLRTALVALALHNTDPAQVLTELDRFVGGPDGADYATVLYVIVDSVQNSIRYASAGHPPAMMIGSNGETIWLDGGQSGPLSGFLETTRQGGVAELSADATLVLYTDGLVERRGESLSVGLRRLKTLMPSLQDASAQETCDRLVHALAPAGGPTDDVVVMVMKSDTARTSIFRGTYPATADELGHIRSSIRSWMTLHELPDATGNDLLIAVGEAVSNIVRHAYPPDTPGKIEVRIKHTRDSMESEISDDGRWRNSTEGASSPGLGLGILRSVSEDLVIEKTNSGTTVSFRIPIPQSELFSS